MMTLFMNLLGIVLMLIGIVCVLIICAVLPMVTLYNADPEWTNRYLNSISSLMFESKEKV